MNDDAITGEPYPVIQCRECGHVQRIIALPTDGENNPDQFFRHKCANCGSDELYQLTDIQIGLAHRKQ